MTYYECTKVPHAQTSVFNKTVLDPNLAQVQILDLLLDRQDEEILNEQQENERSNTSDTTIVIPSSSSSNSVKVPSKLNSSTLNHHQLMTQFVEPRVWGS